MWICPLQPLRLSLLNTGTVVFRRSSGWFLPWLTTYHLWSETAIVVTAPICKKLDNRKLSFSLWLPSQTSHDWKTKWWTFSLCLIDYFLCLWVIVVLGKKKKNSKTCYTLLLWKMLVSCIHKMICKFHNMCHVTFRLHALWADFQARKRMAVVRRLPNKIAINPLWLWNHWLILMWGHGSS